MRLCRACANVVRVTDLRCSRCGHPFPWWRVRRRGRERPSLPFAGGKACPRCGTRTVRARTALWFRPLRMVLGERASYRKCPACGWRGGAVHAPNG
jgi:predicted RNA-binding Zn-ribbon protein involved in translation (DUF1610 family)